jgi:glycosyltransferase involved in cell wall biosynthesis
MVMFTLAIPTKNRAELAFETYTNILNSTNRDYEVLIIDNDDNEETRLKFEKINDPRVRLVRTGGLSMPDNWEQALIHARGQYILILGNKYRIDKFLLEKIAIYINNNSPAIICTELSFFRFPVEGENAISFDKDGWAVIPSQTALKAVSNLDFSLFFNIAPFGYKAIISMEFVRTVQKKYGRFAYPVAPDFSMGYISLLLNQDFHAYRGNFTNIAENAPSNGLSDNYDGPLIQEFRSSLGLDRSLAEYAPITQIEHGYNMLVSDFFYIIKVLEITLPHDWLNSKNYFIEIYKSLMVRHLMFHLDVTRELKLLYAFAEEREIMWSKEVLDVIEQYNHRYIKTNFDSEIQRRATHKNISTGIGRLINFIKRNFIRAR